MTAFLHRLTIILPAARRDGLQAWMVANLGPDWADAFTAGLVPANGPTDAAPTHYWTSFACTEAQAKALMTRLIAQTGQGLPAGWDSMTREQKKAWIDARRVTIRDTLGVDVSGSFNDGLWTDPESGLSALGLTPRRASAAVDQSGNGVP